MSLFQSISKSLAFVCSFTLVAVSASLISSCASLDAEKLIKPSVNQELKLPTNTDPETLQITDSGREAWETLKGHYKVVNSLKQKPFFFITDVVVFERDGKPTLYLYDKAHNTYGFFQGSDCLHSSMNKGSQVDVMLYCKNSQSNHSSFSIAELKEPPVLPNDTRDPFTGLITLEKKTLDTKDATHIGSAQIFGYRAENTLLLKKVSDDTSLNLFKTN